MKKLFLFCSLLLGSAMLLPNSGFAAQMDTVNTPGVKEPNQEAENVTVTFRGSVDGSAELKISEAAALWTNKQFDAPQSVSINNIPWNPRQSNSLPNSGATQFLPVQVNFRKARIERITGRDTVALERNDTSISVFIADTANGASPYEFQITFPRVDTEKKDKITLRLQGQIDGSDEISIGHDAAEWAHKQWGWPGSVRLNGISWDPQRAQKLANSGATKFLDKDVDFLSARVTVRGGRDTIAVETYEDGIIIYLADNPLGAGAYDVVIEFDKK